MRCSLSRQGAPPKAVQGFTHPNRSRHSPQAFKNIAAALAQAGAGMEDVVRVMFIVPRREDWQPCWPVVKRWLGAAQPASTLIHAGLQTDEMRIEVEVTARLRRAPAAGAGGAAAGGGS
jgi:enamine deaminase RidA (YjgF/YER057c/UK114 family)